MRTSRRRTRLCRDTLDQLHCGGRDAFLAEGLSEWATASHARERDPEASCIQSPEFEVCAIRFAE